LYFVANLSKALHINFYQKRSSIVEVMTTNFGVFLCLTVYTFGLVDGNLKTFTQLSSPSSWTHL